MMAGVTYGCIMHGELLAMYVLMYVSPFKYEGPIEAASSMVMFWIRVQPRVNHS